MAALTWKRRLGRLFPVARGKPRRVIVLYHAIGSSPWAVSPRDFREQAMWLREHAQVVPLAQLADGEDTAPLRVAITFDDGYASLFDAAAPILAEARLCATVFLNTGAIAERARQASDPGQGHYPGEHFLTWPESLQLRDAGWALGSHAVDHVDLTTLAPAALQAQLAQSRRDIEARSGAACDLFAYPWGRHDARVRSAVGATGYRLAVSGRHGAAGPRSDLLALPRVDIRADYELADFEAVVTGRWDFLAVKHALAPRLA